MRPKHKKDTVARITYLRTLTTNPIPMLPHVKPRGPITTMIPLHLSHIFLPMLTNDIILPFKHHKQIRLIQQHIRPEGPISLIKLLLYKATQPFYDLVAGAVDGETVMCSPIYGVTRATKCIAVKPVLIPFEVEVGKCKVTGSSVVAVLLAELMLPVFGKDFAEAKWIESSNESSPRSHGSGYPSNNQLSSLSIPRGIELAAWLLTLSPEMEVQNLHLTYRLIVRLPNFDFLPSIM